MKTSVLTVAALAAFSAPWVLAQQPAAPGAAGPDPSFEVASVKRNSSGEQFMRIGGPPGRFTVTNVPLRNLIIQAYQLQPTQLVGGPEWIATERFDITATTGTPPDPAGRGGIFAGARGNPVAPMLRSLLADRFKLKVHPEQREMPVFALVQREPGKLGPALAPTKVDCAGMMAARGRGDSPPPALQPGARPPCSFMMGPGSLAASSVPLMELARTLSQRLGRIVIDRTGLEGLYDFELTFAPESAGAAGGPGGPGGGGAAVFGGGAPPPGAPALPPVDPDAPSLFTALQEQLGLRLDSVRAPVDVIVIDSVERPTED